MLGVSSIDALLALQEVGGPIERRKKAVRRANVILDVLDELKIGVLEGAIQPHTLGRLIEAVRQERARTGDPRLEGVLDEIETRAAVELGQTRASTPPDAASLSRKGFVLQRLRFGYKRLARTKGRRVETWLRQ